jgi:hypothetical protein
MIGATLKTVPLWTPVPRMAKPREGACAAPACQNLKIAQVYGYHGGCWRQRFAGILKAGRTCGSSASVRFLWWQSRGNSYLLPEPGPAKFENIDQDGLHEAGYGPEDFE